MRKLYSMRAYLTLCILAISTLIGGVSAQAEDYLTIDISKYVPSTGNTPIPETAPLEVTPFKIYIEKKSSNNPGLYKSGTNLRFYTNDILHIEGNEGVTISKISFTGTVLINKANTGSFSSSTWTGSANAIAFTGSGTNKITKIEITYKKGEQLPIPEIVFEQESYEMNLGGSLVIKATATLGETTLAEDLITYRSENTDIAEIDPKSGQVTAKAEGKATITAIIGADANNTYSEATAKCILTVKDPRTAPEFSFSEESYTINVNEAKQILPTTNSNGEISYASSNDAVATIDAEGNVTGIAEGDATITATIAATSEYKSATATYQIKVVDPNKPAEVVTPMSFKKVTSTDELIEGGQYIIVCEDQKAVMTEISNTRGQVAQNITITDGTIATDCGAGIITIQKNDDKYVLNLNNSWISATTSTAIDLKSTNTSQNEKWSITFDETTGAAQMTSTDGSRYIRYNTNNGNPMFRNYSSTQANSYSIQLYRLEASATINEKIGYTTFYTDKVYQLADGMTAYTISESDEAGKVNAIEAYAAGEDVPANTALLLGGEAGTYRLPVLNKEVAAYEGENLLEGKRMGNGMTRSDRENVLYYKLTTLNGENPGFYWGAEEGAAFIMKNPTTAYLAVDKAVAGANGLRLVIGESGTTGIGTVTETTQDGAIYTISGIRVNAGSTAGLPKGIYIVNGKKLLVK